jgi:spore maturation protein CgeB
MLKPTITIAVGGLAVDSVNASELKCATKDAGGRLALWLHDDPYEFDYAFKATDLADIVFTNEECCVPHYPGSTVYHLPLAASVEAHFKIIPADLRHDIDLFFCGVAYPNRVEFFRSTQKHLSQLSVVVRGDGWPTDLRFAQNLRLTTGEVCEYSQRSSLTLNIGRSHNIANRRLDLPSTTPGPRTFESALAGGAQLYVGDAMAIYPYFRPGTEILTAETAEEFESAIRFAASNPNALLDIAKKAQERALLEHTYANRAKFIIEMFAKHQSEHEIVGKDKQCCQMG